MPSERFMRHYYGASGYVLRERTMDESKWLELIAAMETVLQTINAIKAQPQLADARGMSVAATHLETAMLWVANAKK